MARFNKYYSNSNFRPRSKGKLTFGKFLTYWALPTLGLLVIVGIYCASKGYINLNLSDAVGGK